VKVIAIGVALVLLAVGGTMLYRIATQRPGPMDAQEFGRTARTLASDAKELARIATLIAEDRLTANFSETQRETLRKDVVEQAKKLEEPPPAGRESDGARARELAAALREALDQLKEQVADRSRLQKMHDELSRIGGELERMGGKP
jgi:hypothetical protein